MFFKRKNNADLTRTVDSFDQLHVGDLVTFKFREALPEGLSGETLTVEEVNTYDYAGELVSDFALSHSSGLKVNASFDPSSDSITFAHKIRHPEIIEIFDGDELATVFDPNHEQASLSLRVDQVDAQRSAWVCDHYSRTLCEAQAYYYNDDRRAKGVSAYEDESVPFTYHELDGNSDHHSISIEVWEDGETEFFAEVTVAATAVDSFLPSGK